MRLEHQAISEETEEKFNKRINEASKEGWVLSSQFGVSMASDSVDGLQKCFHIMLSRKVEEGVVKPLGKDVN